jgi:hypothetical protein
MDAESCWQERHTSTPADLNSPPFIRIEADMCRWSPDITRVPTQRALVLRATLAECLRNLDRSDTPSIAKADGRSDRAVNFTMGIFQFLRDSETLTLARNYCEFSETTESRNF